MGEDLLELVISAVFLGTWKKERLFTKCIIDKEVFLTSKKEKKPAAISCQEP